MIHTWVLLANSDRKHFVGAAGQETQCREEAEFRASQESALSEAYSRADIYAKKNVYTRRFYVVPTRVPGTKCAVICFDSHRREWC